MFPIRILGSFDFLSFLVYQLRQKEHGTPSSTQIRNDMSRQKNKGKDK